MSEIANFLFNAALIVGLSFMILAGLVLIGGLCLTVYDCVRNRRQP